MMWVVNLVSRAVTYFIDLGQKYRYTLYREQYLIHSDFKFNGNDILLYGDGSIKLGKNAYIGRYSILQASKPHQIVVGENCRIGPFVCMWTNSANADHDFMFPETVKAKTGDIIIKDGVWIGAHVVISPGVTIGENSVIGANSIVTKDVPDFAIVGGVPGKILRFKNLK